MVPGPVSFELLEAVAEVADGSLTLQQTVERLLEVLVPEFADVATLDAVDAAGELHHLGARVEAPERAEVEAALMRRRSGTEALAGMRRAADSEGGQLFGRASDEQLRAVASDERDFELLRSLALRSSLLVPLRSRGRLLGALACSVGASRPAYDEADLRFAEVLAGRVALALDNAGLSAMVSSLERRLQGTMANLAEAVLVRDRALRIVYANPAAARLFGAGSVDALTQSRSAEFLSGSEFYDEQGRRLTVADMPGARLLAGEQPEALLVRHVERATGQARWLRYKANAIPGLDGEVELAVSVIEDVTQARRTEAAQRLLAEAGRTLASSLDYEQTLQAVARLAVPELADWCGVQVRGSGEHLDQVAVAHVDPEKVALARAVGERYPASTSDPAGAAEVIRSGQAQLIPEITEELIAAANPNREQMALLSELQMRSVIIVPLAGVGQAPLGALTLVMAESGRVFDAEDLALAEELGRRAAAAVINARAYSERTRIAHTLQRSLLPPRLPDMPGFRVAALYRPAGDENEVGGDFYDAFEVNGGWMVVVGDVAGRGAEAAAVTSLARYTLRSAGKLLRAPVAAIRHLNQALLDAGPPGTSIISVCCALLRASDGTAEAQVVLAGHPPAYLIHRGGAREVGQFAPFLGVYQAGSWRAVTVTLEPGNQLVLYTDGVIDTVGEHERFGEERLAAALAEASSAPDAVQRIENSITSFARGPQADDTAVLAVERAREVISPIGQEPPRADLLRATG